MNEKEFEKQQLEQLLNDLKDVDKYTSFKNGAFIYDLGKYQGSLLVNCINNLQSKIDKAIEYIDYHDVIYNNGYINEKHKFDKSINPKELLDILKEDK